MISNNYKLFTKKLLGKCFMMYAGIGLVVTVGMLLSNKFVSHASPVQFQRTVLGVAACYSLLILLLVLFTACRFYRFDRNATQLAYNQQQHNQLLWARLTSFPGEMFWCYWIIGFIIAQAYRLLSVGLPPWYGEEAVSVWKGILFDGSTFLAFAMIHYSLLRWLLHRELRERELVYTVSKSKPRFYRMTSRIAIIACCGFFYLALRLFWYVYQGVRTESPVSWEVYISIAVVVLSVTLIGLKLAASYLLNDMKRIEERLLQLSVGTASTMRPIAVVSPYEAGELALTFNHLQERFTAEYDRMQKEIQLAYSVQQQLFPKVQLQVGSWKIRGDYFDGAQKAQPLSGTQNEQRANSFFHLTSPSPQYAAFIAGTMNMNGPSASLMMSSLLMLFRSQVELQLSSEHMLQRLHQQLVTVLDESMELHIAIATLDAKQMRLEWALAGQMRINLLTVHQHLTTMRGTQSLSSPIANFYSTGNYRLNSIKQFELEYVKQVINNDRKQALSSDHWVPIITGHCTCSADAEDYDLGEHYKSVVADDSDHCRQSVEAVVTNADTDASDDEREEVKTQCNNQLSC